MSDVIKKEFAILYLTGRELPTTEKLHPPGGESAPRFSPLLIGSHFRALMCEQDQQSRHFYEQEAMQRAATQIPWLSNLARLDKLVELNMCGGLTA